MLLLTNKILQDRVLTLTYRYKLSHLSSTLPAANILSHIYSTRKKDDQVVLSNGHAGLALYAVLEMFEGKDSELLLTKHGIHPNRDIKNGIYCSTGSLGLGLPIAVGLALKNPNTVHCIISDGEMSEGSIWESLKFIADTNITNIKVYAQVNGYGAYTSIDMDKLYTRAKAFYPDIIWCYTDTCFLGVDPLKYHYQVLSEFEYETIRAQIHAGNIKTFVS